MDYRDVIKQIEIQMSQSENQTSIQLDTNEKQDNSNLLNEIGLELQRKGGI